MCIPRPLSSLLVAIGLAAAPAAQVAPAAVPRDVLLIVGRQVDRDRFADVVQTPLDHLGLAVRRHAAHGLGARIAPPPVDPARTRAVVTLFGRGDRCPRWFWSWWEDNVVRHHLRAVHLGNLRPLVESPPGPDGRDGGVRSRAAAWLARLGLVWRSDIVRDPLRVDVETIDAARCAFEERPLSLRVHRGPVSTSSRNVPWVTTVDRRRPTDRRAAVVVGPWGGVAMTPWLLRATNEFGQRRWHVDPFAFFRAALDWSGSVPVPDPTVHWGRRAMLVHVDGDAFVDGDRAGRTLVDAIDRWRVPVTVVFTVGEALPELLASRRSLLDDLLDRPWVEVAGHGMLPVERPGAPGPRPRVGGGVREASAHPESRRPSIDPAPRRLEDVVLDVVAQLDRHLLRRGREARLMFWTGDGRLGRDAVDALEARGVLQLSGRECRVDGSTASLAYVTPRGHADALGVLRVNCALPPRGPGGGSAFGIEPWRALEATFANLARERVLRPINIRLGLDATVDSDALGGVDALLERAHAGREVPFALATSAWAAAVRSAHSGSDVEHVRLGSRDVWKLTGFEACRTVRFDDERRELDLDASHGVAGSRRLGGALFVHLTAADACIALTSAPTAERPYVESANHALGAFSRGDDYVCWTAAASRRGRRVVLAGFRPATRVRVRVGNAAACECAVRADGRVVVELPPSVAPRVDRRDHVLVEVQP